MTLVVSKLDAASPEAREFNSRKAPRFSVLFVAGNWQLCSLPYWYLLGSSWIVIFQARGSEQDLSVQLWKLDLLLWMESIAVSHFLNLWIIPLFNEVRLEEEGTGRL